MNSRWIRISVAAAAAALFTTGFVLAQQSATDESKRKVKSKTAPSYPELAKRMNVSGKVKIEVIITPDGKVRSTRVIGGHPLLVQACQDAVKDWKFVPAAEETTQVIEFEFKGIN
jgi:TonB family protein